MSIGFSAIRGGVAHWATVSCRQAVARRRRFIPRSQSQRLSYLFLINPDHVASSRCKIPRSQRGFCSDSRGNLPVECIAPFGGRPVETSAPFENMCVERSLSQLNGLERISVQAGRLSLVPPACIMVASLSCRRARLCWNNLLIYHCSTHHWPWSTQVKGTCA